MRQSLDAQASDIFLKAAAYIRKYGWRVEGMSRHGQPRCSMGALASVGPSGKWDDNLSKLMYDKLYKELNGLSFTQFNHKFQNGEKVACLYENIAVKIIKSNQELQT